VREQTRERSLEQSGMELLIGIARQFSQVEVGRPRPCSSAVVSGWPRRYDRRLRCSALRARPTTASLEAPLKGVSAGIINAM
jgi:hypothetical protein